MNTIARHIFTAVLYSFLLSGSMIALTIVTFVEDWLSVFEMKIGDVSFLLAAFVLTVTMALITGIVTAVYWKQRLNRIEKQLLEIAKGQKTSTPLESYNELETIEQYMRQIQEKIKSQAEHAQKLATERAQEREQSLQEIVVQERNRLARELHDSVSQQLFAASMMMSAINESNIEGENSKQLQLVEKMIHQSQLEMRALLLHLRPVALKGKSLQEGVEELLVELLQKVPLEIEWKVEAFEVEKGVEDQLFRILQESISNTLRHAEASSLQVMMIEREQTVILRVVDNGVGFDMQTRKTNSYGLQNMQERALEVGGTFKIVSVPGEGTRMEVKVPNLRRVGEGND
ncbi:sensor histidine kinase [Oceanobacillus kapialis]|uniref:Sensor histidine kinase n=1 Tax=Oceanobacillus kapialis TaxID=481353 RepID=A0ABW5Q0X0_9BACI